MTNQSPQNINRQLRIWILIISIISILSLFSVTMTTFAWGIGDTAIFFLLLYPALILSTILIVVKIRFGFALTLTIAITYAILFIRHIGKYFIFDFDNYVLLFVLLLPFLTIISLIPLTTALLFGNYKKRKVITAISVIISLFIPFYAIAERSRMNYTDSVFAEFTIDNTGMIKIICKPQPSDTRIFYLTSKSKELVEVFQSEGTFLIDYYYVANTIIEKNYHFKTLQSLTIRKLNNKELQNPLIWKVEEIKGDLSFLEP